MFIDGLTQVKVESASETIELIKAGLAQRKPASHAVFILEIEKVDKSNHETSSGKLAIVDLAGPEHIDRKSVSPHKSEEAKAVNTSLSALATVLSCLLQPTKGSQHVPYRSSKFTRALQVCLFYCCKISREVGGGSMPKKP